MAHPLTQHPKSALPFGAAARPSPFGFGFGGSSSNAFAGPSTTASSVVPSVPSPSPSRPKFGTSFSQPHVGPSSPAKAFGSTAGKSVMHGSPRVASFLHAPTPTVPGSASLKRSRRSVSPTPSSSPSPAPSISSSPKRSSFSSRKGDDLAIDGLDIAEGSSAPGRRLKRLRKTAADAARQPANEDEYDTGVLLASLPASAHLQILQNLLKDDPSLKSKVLAHMPTPDLQECLRSLALAVDSMRRSMPSPGVLPDAKLHGKIQRYCHQAQTYLRFFASPPVPPAPPPSSMFALLQNVTDGVGLILSFLQEPSSRSTLDLVQADISNVATTLIDRWRQWVTDLDDAANSRGEMFPHSFLTTWFEGLDRLVNTSPLVRQNPHDPFRAAASPNLAAPYYSALAAVRATMVDRLGWTIGRAPGSY